jgi:putative ABC transport system permease protein
MLDNIRAALQSIWLNKGRSILTVLGVVIGVFSVTTLVAVGKGLEKDMTNLVQGFGSNVIMVIAGKIDPQDPNAMSNPANFFSGDIIRMSDVEQLRDIAGVVSVTPASIVAGSVQSEDRAATPTLLGVTPNIFQSVELFQIGAGRMFNEGETRVIVLNPRSAQLLFPGQDPLGKEVMVGKGSGLPFTVIGTLAKPKVSNTISQEFERMAFIPFQAATELNGRESILRLFIKAGEAGQVEAVRDQIKSTLRANHNGEEEFTVMTQEDLLDLFGRFLDLTTVMVTALAAISLLVGGIGIMNIMLVTVTERTREIGLRKAVGATQRAILSQFLVESVVVTLMGGLIGLLFSLAAGKYISLQSDLNPAFTGGVISLALGVSTLIGLLFGLWPAWRAARKDPIEALRYE